ncbi:MAG: HEAT repeat domain-containing protein [Chloroflexi bacterium]|nr:HEAT repeat domain-containing protein [Chloroflexota bacterium]
MDITSLLAELDNPNSVERRNARLALIQMGRAAIPALVKLLADAHHRVRWEAAKALEVIDDVSTAPAFIGALEDEDFGIRWLAAEALGRMGAAGLRPLLLKLVADSGNSWLREGAHHALHFYNGELNPQMEQLLRALEDTSSTTSVPWAAGIALQSLEQENPSTASA